MHLLKTVSRASHPWSGAWIIGMHPIVVTSCSFWDSEWFNSVHTLLTSGWCRNMLNARSVAWAVRTESLSSLAVKPFFFNYPWKQRRTSFHLYWINPIHWLWNTKTVLSWELQIFKHYITFYSPLPCCNLSCMKSIFAVWSRMPILSTEKWVNYWRTTFAGITLPVSGSKVFKTLSAKLVSTCKLIVAQNMARFTEKLDKIFWPCMWLDEACYQVQRASVPISFHHSPHRQFLEPMEALCT